MRKRAPVKRKPRPGPPPTLAEACAVIHTREVGGRVVCGATETWAPADLGDGRFAVRVVSYMARDPMPDVVLVKARGKWTREKAEREPVDAPADPLSGGGL